MEKMKKVFVCSKFRGENKSKNVEVASYFCRKAIDEGMLPIAPHLYFPSFLDEKIYEEDRTGILLGVKLLNDCDMMWAIVDSDLQVSEGMFEEIQYAWDHDIPIKFMRINDHMEEPRKFSKKIYIYRSCCGGYYATTEEQDLESCYCETCGSYSDLLVSASNTRELFEMFDGTFETINIAGSGGCATDYFLEFEQELLKEYGDEE